MGKAAIVYHSEHHGNTRKLLEAAAQTCPVDLLEEGEAQNADLSQYEAVGFASGIYMSKLHRSLYDFLNTHTAALSGKKSFVLYTSGSGNSKYAADFAKQLEHAGMEFLGTFSCKGFDTYGPFKFIGGISKGHPSQEDAAAAARFLKETVLTKLSK